ncbi:MAG: abortive infection family protein [Leptospiraceae bacterium]|nr:abortive infection family protein [Leptospiraceae bacterium]MBP9887618.1 abortive infection family protein [Leptospiraceae bacterium]
MDKLKNLISQYRRWAPLELYTERIETYINSDFSQALENVKALLESIGKEICSSKGIELDSASSINGVLKKAFSSIGYNGDSMVTQISGSLANIGQQIGDLRNEIGATAHGRSLKDLQERNDRVDEFTREFLIDSTTIVACFLIRAFENENPGISVTEEIKLIYPENEEFNNNWDDLYGEFEMGEYSYTASEILYNVDYPAYATEQKAFLEADKETN